MTNCLENNVTDSTGWSMVRILDGNSEYVAHVWTKTNILYKMRLLSEQMTYQVTNIIQHVRTYFWLTISYKNHGLEFSA